MRIRKSSQDRRSGKRSDHEGQCLEAKPPIVLLAHDPDNFGEAIGAEVNLLLVGHTHGGQIGISFLIKKSNSAKKSSFMRGLFDAGKTKMYVNRGIATTHIPIRFFNRPEITVFTIRK